MSAPLIRNVKSLSVMENLLVSKQQSNKNGRVSFPIASTNNDKTKMDVVDVISVMHEGSKMILLTKENEIINELEYQFCFLSKDNENICGGPTKNKLFSIKEIANVSTLENEQLYDFETLLNMNGISTIGLSSLMFFIDFKENSENNRRLFVIGESHRMTYIWFYGLQNLNLNNKSKNITSLPLIVSNRLRIGRKHLYQKASTSKKSNENQINKSNETCGKDSNVKNDIDDDDDNDNENESQQEQQEDLIKSFEKDSLITKHISDLYSFASRACILDSTEHLTLLSQASSLKNVNEEIRWLIQQIHENASNANNISNYDHYIGNVEELYYELHSECAVVTLKSYHMQNDMRLSRQ